MKTVEEVEGVEEVEEVEKLSPHLLSKRKVR
jgi:hypothetical protein